MGNFDNGFFEYIAAASNEKVHSQTIAWIFSENCKIISAEEKGEILKNLITNETNEHSKLKSEVFKPIKVFAEIEDIDILIVCKECFIVIENKVKSSEHSNQLIKYEYLTSEKQLDPDKLDKIKCNKCNKCKRTSRKECERFDKLTKIKEQFLKELRDKKGFYVFLSLIDESKKVIDPWDAVKYGKLFRSLNNELGVSELKHIFKKDYYILNEYLSTLKKLVHIFENEQDKNLILNHVFSNGKSKKLNILLNDQSDKLKESIKKPIIKYIHENQLETILQKQFYNQIIINLNRHFENENIIPIVSESNGTALLDFHFKNISFSNKKICLGILQFQGNNIKLAISVDDTHNTTLEKECKKFKSVLEKNLKDDGYITNTKLTNPGVTKIGIIKDYGFSSVKINLPDKLNNNGYWQLLDKPEDVVENCLLFAIDFFKPFIKKLNS